MNKRIFVMILAMLLVFGCLVTSAGATAGSGAGAVASPSANESNIPGPVEGALSIESTQTYPNMTTSYANGYSPVVNGDVANITLPLVSEAGIVAGGAVTFSLNLGDSSSSPFVYNNYGDMVVGRYDLSKPLIPNQQSVFAGKDLYFFSKDLPLKGDRSIGTYPVTVTASYTLADGTAMTQDFPVYVIIRTGIDPNATPTPEPTPPSGTGNTSQPKLIVSNYTISPNEVYAGEMFRVDVRLKNTSTKAAVKNIVVTYTSETTDMLPGEGTNSAYIDRIEKDQVGEFSFTMEARADAKAGPQKIDLAISYEDSSSNPLTGADVVTVQVRQRIRLEYDQPKFPAQVYMGDSMSTSLNLYNKGKNTLYNVTVLLEVPGITPESSVFLGNMESGAAKTADIYASVEMSAMPEPEIYPDEMDPSMMEENGVVFEDAQPMAANLDLVDMAAVAEPAVIGGEDGPVSIEVEGGNEDMVPEEGMDLMEEGDMGGGVMPGPISGRILVTYEDEYGDEYDLEIPVDTVLMEMPTGDMYPPDEMVPEEEAAGFPWWGWVIIAAAAVVVVVIIVTRVRKKRREKELREELEDDDIL